jgi:hypothetical protein
MASFSLFREVNLQAVGNNIQLSVLNIASMKSKYIQNNQSQQNNTANVKIRNNLRQ